MKVAQASLTIYSKTEITLFSINGQKVFSILPGVTHNCQISTGSIMEPELFERFVNENLPTYESFLEWFNKLLISARSSRLMLCLNFRTKHFKKEYLEKFLTEPRSKSTSTPRVVVNQTFYVNKAKYTKLLIVC